MRARTRPRAWRRLVPWSLPIGILLTLLARAFPGAVETLYSRGLYRAVAAGFAGLTGWVPFSVGEPLLVAVVLWAGWGLVRFVRRLGRARGARLGLLLEGGRAVASAAGLAYLFFLLSWGLNYHRRPLAANLGLETGGGSVGELVELCEALVAEANALRPEDEALLGVGADDLRAAYAALGEREPLVRGFFGRPKPALASGLLSRFGVTGIFWPFTGEPHLNTTVVPALAPATAAHELAHQRGFAGEGDATFVGILACRAAPSPALRYSGAFCALLWALDGLLAVDRDAWARCRAALAEPVRADVQALAEWRSHFALSLHLLGHEVAVMEFGLKMNDAYLRANAQAQGVESYGGVVDLLLAERRRTSGERAESH